MWQDGKEGMPAVSAAQMAEFKVMLGSVNMLYLGCQVLVLLDVSYLSRFWTMYEGWLSQQQPTAQGLKLAEAEQALDLLEEGGGTNLWDGLFRGLETCRAGASAGRHSSVLLLTDGLPNVEPPRGHIPMLKKYISRHGPVSSVHTFGFG